MQRGNAHGTRRGAWAARPRRDGPQPQDYDTAMDLEGLRILLYPAQVLERVAEPVASVDADIVSLVGEMARLMREADGVGLAAPQVGVSKRLFVTMDPGDEAQVVAWINPEIDVLDDTLEAGIEGCLSLPGIDVSVRRPAAVRIRGVGLDGKPQEATSSEHIARVWQHEHDHLDGRLIIDRMSTMDRMRNRKALRSLLREDR